jgi:hypothetical protein
MVSLGEKVFWTVIALSSIGAAAFGYHRFKQIRPDLYGTPQAVTVPEKERKARIADYQQKGDALTRAAAPPAPTVRAPVSGETCLDGAVVTAVEAKPVVENGRPVRCASPAPPAR